MIAVPDVRAPFTRRVTAWGEGADAYLQREAMAIAVVAGFALFSLQLLSSLTAPVTWLSLVGGREIVGHGLPHHDTMAILSAGRPWVDQQWLAHLTFYELWRVGGMHLLALVSVACVVSALAVAVVAARGTASPGVVALCSVPALFYSASPARPQVFAQILFVVLIVLLVRESRRPSQRVWLALPLIVLWANVHGSVLVAATLVSLLGACELASIVRRRRMPTAKGAARALVLLVGAWPLVFATPYGLGITTYYRNTVLNPLFPRFLAEWKPAHLSWHTGLFFFALVAVVALGARRLSKLTLFEATALVLLGISGLLAVRSILWFAYAALIICPSLFAVRHSETRGTDRRLRRLIPALALFTVAAAAVTLAVGPTTTSKDWPSPAAQRISTLLRSNRAATVLASPHDAAWVLFNAPESRGRIAVDGSWEVLSQAQFASYARLFFGGSAPPIRWRDYSVVVLAPQRDKGLLRLLRKADRYSLVFGNGSMDVFSRA